MPCCSNVYMCSASRKSLNCARNNITENAASRLTKAKLCGCRWTMLKLMFSLHFFEDVASKSRYSCANRCFKSSSTDVQSASQSINNRLVSVPIHTRNVTSVNHRSPEPTRLDILFRVLSRRVYADGSYVTSCTSSARRALDRPSHCSVPVTDVFRKFESGTSLDDILDTHGSQSSKLLPSRRDLRDDYVALC